MIAVIPAIAAAWAISLGAAARAVDAMLSGMAPMDACELARPGHGAAWEMADLDRATRQALTIERAERTRRAMDLLRTWELSGRPLDHAFRAVESMMRLESPAADIWHAWLDEGEHDGAPCAAPAVCAILTPTLLASMASAYSEMDIAAAHAAREVERWVDKRGN